MNFKKLYGFKDETVADIRHVVSTTRDSLKHIIAGMRWRPRTDEYVLYIYDRSGMTTRIIAVSKDMGSRDKLTDRYIAFCEYFDLPYCCDLHKRRFSNGEDEMDSLFHDEIDDLFGDSDMDDLFDDGDEDDWDIAGDDDEEWDI